MHDSKFCCDCHCSCAGLHLAFFGHFTLSLPKCSARCLDTSCGWHSRGKNVSQSLTFSLQQPAVPARNNLTRAHIACFASPRRAESLPRPDSCSEHSPGPFSATAELYPLPQSFVGVCPRACTFIHLEMTCLLYVICTYNLLY